MGNTARHYARAAFQSLGMDAVTLNPYMGYDAVEPFISDASRGAFILCYTSNNSSQDFQQIPSKSGEPLYLRVAAKAREWNSGQNVGLVVGATQAASVGEVRAIAPDLPILAPGVGAQGGDLETVLNAGRSASGYGLIIPISRAIIYAGTDQNYADRAGEQAQLYKNTIQKAVAHE
ncbi:MAG: orotidine-5'-phosphate decarboxylase [Calditrichota bacterium]